MTCARLDYFDELRSRSILMCNYATVFHDLNTHIAELRPVTRGFQCYVVGNSTFRRRIFTEVILGRLFELNGFKVMKSIIQEAG